MRVFCVRDFTHAILCARVYVSARARVCARCLISRLSLSTRVILTLSATRRHGVSSSSSNSKLAYFLQTGWYRNPKCRRTHALVGRRTGGRDQYRQYDFLCCHSSGRYTLQADACADVVAAMQKAHTRTHARAHTFRIKNKLQALRISHFEVRACVSACRL